MSQSEHENLFVTAFVDPQRKERARYLLKNATRRKKFLQSLHHFHDLDQRFVKAIAPSEQTAEGIADILKRGGAPATCWVISTDKSLDGRQMLLEEALAEIVGMNQGSILSCIPGELAYYEGEGPSDRFILQRSSKGEE